MSYSSLVLTAEARARMTAQGLIGKASHKVMCREDNCLNAPLPDRTVCAAHALADGKRYMRRVNRVKAEKAAQQ